jgi:hypothetical protein
MEDKIKRNWSKLTLAVPLVVFGLVLAFFGNEITNPLVIILGFGSMGAGTLIIKNWWQAGEVRITRPSREMELKANQMIIYDDLIEFTYEEKPEGWQQKCLNDGKYYYVKVCKDGELEQFKLPTRQAQDDPREFANPVKMDCNKKYLEFAKFEFQKVPAIIIGLVIGCELIALIAIGG